MGENPAGAIATAHTLATETGEAAYAAGGNALDAALAAAASLTVVYPHNTSIGGDLVALVRSPAGRITCVNATGPSPRAQQASALRDKYGASLPVRGVDTITVPGAVRGWQRVHELGAALPWRHHFAAAAAQAREGVPLARSVAQAIIKERDALARDTDAARLFLPGGRPIGEGELLRQPALADTLDALAHSWPDAFYTGAVGDALVAGLRAKGSLLSEADFALFSPESPRPLSTQFRGYRVYTSPPNTQGFALMRTLNALRIRGLAEDAGVLGRLFHDGAIVRDTLLADPRYSDLDLVTDGFARLLLSLDEPRTAAAAGAGEPVVPGGDTVGIAAADSNGWAVSLIQSLYYSFGAAVLEPQTGIQLHNRGMSFSLEPASPNVFAPGKRPRHTLMPVMVTRGDELKWVNATMGGHAQAQIHAQLLISLTHGATPQQAVSAPRFIVGARAAGDPADAVYTELDVPPAVAEALLADAFPVRLAPRHVDWMGHANVVEAGLGGHLTAGSDPRSDGSASVVAIGARGAATTTSERGDRVHR